MWKNEKEKKWKEMKWKNPAEEEEEEFYLGQSIGNCLCQCEKKHTHTLLESIEQENREQWTFNPEHIFNIQRFVIVLWAAYNNGFAVQINDPSRNVWMRYEQQQQQQPTVYEPVDVVLHSMHVVFVWNAYPENA